MAPSNSPQKLIPSPTSAAVKTPKKYAAQAVTDDGDNITGNQSGFGDREDVGGQPADTQAVIVGSDKNNTIICNGCSLGDREDVLFLLCKKCNRGYHADCARPIVVRIPMGSWFCSDCTLRPHPENLSQKEMDDFFRIQRSNEEESSSSHESRKRKRRSIHFGRKIKTRLLPYVPSKDHEKRFKQMQSLAIALISQGMEFSRELTYSDQMAPRAANRAELEISQMQVFSRENRKTMEKCIKMMKNGKFPPLLVVYDSDIGYTVQADDNIKGFTFLFEHTGDVDYAMNRERDDCDSLMSLLYAHDSSKSLIICQDRRGNIGRFVSGINNHTGDWKKKENVKAVRYNVDGESRVFIIASRDIAKGARLYLDYNGFEEAYPTEHFV